MQYVENVGSVTRSIELLEKYVCRIKQESSWEQIQTMSED